MNTLTTEQRSRALAFARAIIPDGARLPGGSARTIDLAEELVRSFSPRGSRALGALVDLLDTAAVARTGRRFHRLRPDRQEQLLQRWERDPLLRLPLFALSFALKAHHFDDPEVYRAMGCVYEKGGPAEPARWLQQVMSPEEWDDGDIECDVVVVGTGSGGAVVGKKLAERGLAVVFLEEGKLYRRDAFNGRGREAHKKFYRGHAGIVTVGNAVMPVLMGRLVGGSTAINTGTCFRTPKWILDDWCERIGTDELSEDNMRPHFDQVERELQVEPAPARYAGAVARIVARGCDRLGWHHFPVRRNAPDCDGQGVCDFGCPTGARRSTDVSFIPPALERGAVLFPELRAERVSIENGRAVGVEARAVASGRRLTVRARAVVLACGAVPTPLFLEGQGICLGSGQVGRNLSLHPGTGLSALFDEKVEGYNSIPQGMGCELFHRQGILMLGASAPLDFGALMFPFTGRRFMDAMEAFDRVASFGVMIEDESRGRVRRRPDGSPRITYWMSRKDAATLHRGLVYIGEIFRAAGARKLFPVMPRFPIIDGDADFERFRALRPRPWDYVLTSFHPIGTCRMGTDPSTSVVGLDHQTHEVPGLFIVDGSTVPGPPAVNPQLTIMAMAHRAAGLIADRLPD